MNCDPNEEHYGEDHSEEEGPEQENDDRDDSKDGNPKEGGSDQDDSQSENPEASGRDPKDLNLRNRIGRIDNDLYHLTKVAEQAARGAAARDPNGSFAPLVATLHLALADMQRRTEILKEEI